MLGGAAALLLNWGWLFQQAWLGELARAARGLVSPTLIASPGRLIVTVVLARVLGGLAPRHLGLELGRIALGIAFVAAVWFAAQMICAGVAVAAGYEVYRDTLDVGSLIAQICGNALNEEVFWRG